MGTGAAPMQNQTSQVELASKDAGAATGGTHQEARQDSGSSRVADPLKTQADIRPDQEQAKDATPAVSLKQGEVLDTQASDSLEQAPGTPAAVQGRDSNVTTVAQAERNQESSTSKAPLPVWRQGAQTQAPTPSGQAPRAQSNTGDQPIRLFQSAAFRGNFNALPKWKRILSKVKGQLQTLGSCTSAKTCPPGATSWQRIMKQARGKERMEQLKMINSFFNKWPYRLDQDAYGVSDWWATPQEFLKISGDCEDYAIIKYFALRELGFSMDELRIVVVKDRIRGIAHAVLAVFTDGDAYILNNISDAIFTHGKYRHYIPQYSLNEEHRWSHIPVAN